MASSNKFSDIRAVVALTPSAQFMAVGGVCAVGSVVLGWGVAQNGPGVLVGLGVYAVAITIALIGLRISYPHRAIGLCNVATIVRLMLVSVLIAALIAPDAPAWAVFAVALVAFALDGLDGWLARKEGRSSAFGARFDMEVDSILALVLALLAWNSGAVGAYVIILGLPRYAFWIAQFPFPWLNGDLPDRFSRKVVCVLQISALILVLVPVITAPVAGAVAGVAALALVWSFTLDVRLLWQARS